ncbi:amidohydrolase [Actinacidiphila bryophytorum]|uniref:Hippurate hydrolase n=1 Tax=Actinacidiphila bryophytorum TaxID=1436133 RepID=A0A9W4H644_9ACTN|nr:amidohydrolase [Actinacidiphila bryophytorum]MBM9438589.1 amidohydrolase [Actinacidiphila bryophytorum]MBN6544105.1 amidohydrolase [Actinacidiphila bryophytorum]CAG7653663.1 Hippurate hydrolase [Actinacidiphila bryophytorum]
MTRQAAPERVPVPEAVPPAVLASAAELYVALHRDPELSGAEERTAARFAAALRTSGLEVTAGVGGHGVVGVLRNGPGPVVMVRAELDALPVREDTGLPYASEATAPGPDGRTVPVMHACGHDAHLAALSGAAAALKAGADGWRGTLVAVGQPAEETLNGAAAMLADGLYGRFPVPSHVLAQHVVPLPAGMVAHAQGPLLAGSTTLEVVLHGRGGHAAAPQLAADPVITAAAVVLRLQTVVSRETGPGEPLVVTVGALRAGTPGSGNVIADRAALEVTVRSFTAAGLDRAVAAVRRIVRAEAAAGPEPAPPEPEVRVLSRSLPTVPDPAATEAVRQAHLAAFGPQRVARWQPSMATEDVALYGDAGRDLHGVSGVRTAYWMFGGTGPRQWAAAGGPGADAAARLAALPANHSPHFAPHPRLTLETGVAAMTAAVRAALAMA